MNTPISDIVNCLVTFEEHTKLKPTDLYVGYEQYQALVQKFGSKPPKVWGAEVHYVTCKSFLGAGWRDAKLRSSVRSDTKDSRKSKKNS